jgi:uncharacterized protein YjbI with pentapeptide repeats
MIEIKNRWTGDVILSVDAETLSRADLSRANLTEANLSRADLTEANLTEANLSGANLSGANLSGAIVADGYALVGHRSMLQLGPLGSRSATLIAFRTDKGLMVRTGCFFGAADQFVDAVRKTHEDSTHAADYMAALDFIRNWFARTE